MWVAALSQFFISEWLWSVTWGVYHNFFAILLLLFLLKLFLRISFVSAVLLSVFAQLFSFLFYTLFVVGFLMFILGIEYDMMASSILLPGPLHACLLLGLIYAVLQIFFFYIVRFYYTLPLLRVSVLVVISNALAALLTYLLLSYM